jgi:hypothetical protein
MKPLYQKPGEKPERHGSFRETPYKKNEKNYCYIELSDERMPPTKNPGARWEWVSYENYDGKA